MGIIQINHLSYTHPDRTALFDGISFSVAANEKAAITGANGCGKSTLLQIIASVKQPSAGDVAVTGRLYYIPQHFGQYDGMTIAGALGIAGKIEALHAIMAGDASEQNYDILQDDWEIEDRAKDALARWGLSGFQLSHPLATLSGGEKTRVFLSGISVYDPDILLMDEPSNHLDRTSRIKLYSLIKEYPAAMLVVSHDRTLLNLIGKTIELGPDGAAIYGGNYEFYKAQKDIQAQAMREHIAEKEKSLRLARKTAREAAERKEKSDARGEKKAVRSGVPRIMMKTLADTAAASSRKLNEAHAGKIEGIAKELGELRVKAPDKRDMRLKLDDSSLYDGKTLVSAEGINVSYGQGELWNPPLSFRIASGERIAIEGDNGSGKTTLLKLILGQLDPSQGTIRRADGLRYIYVDQEYSLIDNSMTVFEQVESFNLRKLPEHMLKTELHRFLFPADTWDKPCGQLSGGEKMRLVLCCVLIANASPDLFILDEPTNNLDIQSLEIVQDCLSGYRGTILIISHDEYFKRETGIQMVISL